MAILLFHYAYLAGFLMGIPGARFTEVYPVTQHMNRGVQFFFMISGYVISMSMENRTAMQFLASRIVRLYPAYWFCVLATYGSAVLLDGWHPSTYNLLINLTMLQSFFGVPDLDGVYWTLGIELRCYGLVFLLMLMNGTRHYRLFLMLWLVLCLYASKLCSDEFYQKGLMFEWSLYFVAGACFYLIHKKQGRNAWVEYLMLAATLTHILTLVPKEVAHFNNAFGMTVQASDAAYVTLFLFAIFFLLVHGGLNWLNHRGFLYLGALTYPLYLLHQNIGYSLMRRLFPQEPSYINLALFILAWLIAAWGVHRCIEEPVQRRLKPRLLAMFRREIRA